MNTNPEPDALRSRWTLQGRIPLSGVADGAQWRRARSVSTGRSVVLFIVRGETALEAADAVRRAYLVEDPHLLPVQDIVVFDDPRDDPGPQPVAPDPEGPTTVVEYQLPPAPPLAALLAEGPLHPETARAIIGEAATGLEVARRRGVRHQFLDSNRVFVDTGSGSVTVLGIGVEAAAHSGLDRSRETASFQDTVSLVALLYRALTGRSPKPDASGAVPRPSSVVDTEIPADLDLLCELVLGETDEDIPETTRELIEALEPWQSIPVTLEAYPRDSSPRPPEPAAAAPGPLSSADGDSSEATAADAAPPAATTEPTGDDDADDLEPTAAMGAVGDADAPARADDSAEGPAAVPAPAAEVETPEAGAAGEGSPASPAGSAPSGSSGEARALVEELRLDQKRGTSPFPGHLDITAPPGPTQDDGTADGGGSASAAVAAAGTAAVAGSAAGAAGTAAAVAGAAGAAAPDPGEGSVSSSPSTALPSHTPGRHWPLAPGSASAAASLSPSRAPEGSDGRAQQPEDPGTDRAGATPDRPTATPHPDAAQSPDAADATASSAPIPVPGRPDPRAGAPHDGPIVVQGRNRSLLEEEVDESTVPVQHASLFRDVVGVAVGTDDPETYAMGPQDREKRSLQAQWIIIGGAILVMIALVFALTTATRGIRDILEDPLATSQSSTAPAQESAEPTSAPAEEPTEEPTSEEPSLPAPELADTEMFALPEGENIDHEEELGLMTDGDPSSYWSTQHYAGADYGGLKDGVGVRLSLAEPSELTAVVVTTALNSGGTLELRAVDEGGALGEVLATGELAGDGQVRLAPEEPVETDRVAVVVTELPPDSRESGRFRARIAEIEVE